MSSSFDEVFEEEFEQLYGYLRRRVGTAVAEDLTAEAFAVAYRRWGDRDPLRATRPWLYGIANNLLRHHWRKERRMLRAYSRTGPDQAIQDDDAPLERLAAEAQKTALACALAELSRGERDVLLLQAWAGLSDSEIGEALSVPLGTVKSRLHRAREHLRNCPGLIGQEEVEAPPTAKEIRQ